MTLNSFAPGRKALSLLMLAALAACGGAPEEQAPPPAPVTVAAPLQQEVRDWDDFVGRGEAARHRLSSGGPFP